MKEDVLDIRTRLLAGRFVNEASISQGIVLRILGRLGWPTYDTSVVVPEYALEGRRVDFALCHPPLKPLVFVEVKQPGEGTDADRQLFEYAFLRGVQVAILTTGQEWHFYLPAERGAFVERRVYGLDLLERDPDESVERLTRYLEYAATCSGEAYERARADYRDVAREREIQRTLPDAWSRLVAEGNEALLALLSDKVESVCGFKPEFDIVAEFLRRGLVSNGYLPSPYQAPTPRRVPVQRTREVQESKTADQLIASPNQPVHVAPQRVGQRTDIGFEFFGQWHPARNGSSVLAQLLGMITDRDPGFPERFIASPRPKGKRTQIARSPLELFPGRPDLAAREHASREFRPGWWVDVNLSTGSKIELVRRVCEVANLRYGTDVKVEFGKA